ncbi:MAG: deoxyribose-phosphate aldolase [Erysipelotrichaceae bacterium]|nr:deoxyribose-phosphate aldolase [Erysipelotrichaceae bacterium]MDD3924437.1 deoxyribose-phosphate aldolase [Erysipelotrichaceae bacterium]
MKKYTVNEFAKLIDHTYLKPFAREVDLIKLCNECREYEFAMAAINSYPTALCHQLLKGSKVHVGAAIGFPLGQTCIDVKVYETELAIKHGADEIDYVLNIGKLIDDDLDYIRTEMQSIKEVCDVHGVILKVIFETCYLSKEQIIKAALIAKEVQPDFIKTSTGFGTAGATVENVRLMKETVGEKVKVKASGGIKDLKTMLAMLDAGAERIGTSSSVSIINEYKEYIG